ncbi:MAG: BatD family protein, partial [Proteobacteria bacterium]|nr:BatD family protein [Pseudomonadota bacterium]
MSTALTQTCRGVVAALILLFAGLAAAQDIEVSVNRSELARGETLIFTIRVFDQRQGMQLDLTPLTENFDVLGTRTSSQIRSVNGVVDAWTDYIITLFPLNEGELIIPALSINNAVTEAITIVVVNEGPRSNQSSDELFLEIEVNKDSVYVQEQLLFTVRLFYTINGIRNPQFTELEMPDTVIQPIGSPNQYEKIIDGMRYGVYEKRYVIFSQRSGSL